jgi:hypothetical protein
MVEVPRRGLIVIVVSVVIEEAKGIVALSFAPVL